jgi:arsenite methyltransferase
MKGVEMATDLRSEVRNRYAEAARGFAAGTSGGCGCEGSGCCGEEAETDFGSALYAAGEQAELPKAVGATSLGCGNPVAVAELSKGETVLDLGSGGGLDVLLSARRVGPSGLVYGLDMTDEMLELAKRNATKAGVQNVRFLKGFMEQIPLADESVDVVISNCVVNLSSDKPAVLHEIARVLRPGGRVGIADVVAENQLSAAERAERGSFVGCIAGALSEGEYRRGLEEAGLVDVEVQFTHRVADRMHGAIVRARKPVAL